MQSVSDAQARSESPRAHGAHCNDVPTTSDGPDPDTVLALLPPRRPGTYYFGAVSCRYQLTRFEYSGLFIQADGNHLSTGHLPMPLVALVFLALWSSAALCYGGALLWHSDRRRVYMHWTLLGIALGMVANFALEHAYWVRLSESGTVSRLAEDGGLLYRVVLYTSIYTVVLLISRGLSVTRPSLRGHEWTVGEWVGGSGRVGGGQ